MQKPEGLSKSRHGRRRSWCISFGFLSHQNRRQHQRSPRCSCESARCRQRLPCRRQVYHGTCSLENSSPNEPTESKRTSQCQPISRTTVWTIKAGSVVCTLLRHSCNGRLARRRRRRVRDGQISHERHSGTQSFATHT